MQQNQQNPPSQPPPGPGGGPPGGPPGPGRGGRGGFGMARPPIPPEYQADKIFTLGEPELLKILSDSASTRFQKSVACKRLAQVGTKVSVQPVAALLPDPELSEYARFALEPLPDASVDDAFRAAVPKLKGGLLVGLINSIGQRRDPKAVDMLARTMLGADAEVAQAAAEALGRIGGAGPAKILKDGLSKTKGNVRGAVAAGALTCAQDMLKTDRTAPLALFDVLSRPDIPKPVRLAAMHSQIAAETSTTRPRSRPADKK